MLKNYRRCYIITCDLQSKEGEDIVDKYNSLFEKIKSYDFWMHISNFTWAIITTGDAEGVRNDLFEVLDEEDTLFVIKSGAEAAWVNVHCDNKHLKEYL